MPNLALTLNDSGGKFAADVIDIGGAPGLANISANFLEKKSK
jgi:hypothetical protein